MAHKDYDRHRKGYYKFIEKSDNIAKRNREYRKVG